MLTTTPPEQGARQTAAIASSAELSPEDARRVRLIAHYAQTRARYTDRQIEAVTALYEASRRHGDTGGGSTCRKVLLGLYNGGRFPFDLTNLRRLDCTLFAAAMVVIQADARQTYCEVHELLNAIYSDGRNVGGEFEQWAYDMRLKGRGKKEWRPTNVGPTWERH